MEKLASANGLVVRQVKEWGEILTSFETRNRYAVSDATSGDEIYYCAEEAGSGLVRTILKAKRPFRLSVLSSGGQAILTITRPFRFYFHKVEIANPGQVPLGRVLRQFSLVRRIYAVIDSNGTEICQIFGPILRPWTFKILVNGTEFGQIQKKWSGLLKEGFTDADNFGVTFPPQFDTRQRALILGAVFLIDFAHFEE